MEKKRIVTALVALSMLTSTAPLAFADYGCDVIPNSIDSVTVSTESITYTSENYFCAKLNLKNDSTEKEEVKIKVSLKDAKGNTLAKSLLTRQLKGNQTIPVKLSAADVCNGKDVKLYVDVERTGLYNKIYVAPNGKDTNAGTKAQPLKTASAAIKKLSQMNQNPEYANYDITVEFEEGEYNVSSPLVIDEAKTENLSSVTVKGAGEDSVLYGGVMVKGSDFTEVTDTLTLSKFGVSDGLYKLDLGNYDVTTNYKTDVTSANDPIFDTLYYNSNMCQIARYPNATDGFITSDISVDTDSKLTITSDSLSSKWTDYDEAWIRGWFVWEWDLCSGHVGSIAGNKLETDKFFARSFNAEDLPLSEKSKKWYIYNMPQALDIEGEYVINDNILYFCPPKADVQSGAFSRNAILLNYSNKSVIDVSDAKNLTIEKLTFENSKGTLLNVNADNVKVAGCKFTNGMNGLAINGDDNLVTSCDFVNLGGNGATVSGGNELTLTNSGSVIRNCYFNQTGQINRTNCPALTLGGCGVTATKNTLTGTPHSAVAYNGNKHTIEYNDLYDCLKDNAGDAGIIYTGNNLSNLGTVIKHNYLHDSNSGLGGIYWDDWLSGQTALENVFENLENTLLIHGGICNTFSGNIIKNATRGLAVRGKSRTQTKNGVTFNVWDSKAISYAKDDGGYNPYSNVFLANLVGNYLAPQTYVAKPWKGEAWQAAFGNVLKYIDNKNTDVANETTFKDNTFVNVGTAIYPYAATAMSDLTLSGNREGLNEVPSDKLDLYNDVVSHSGIYSDNYREVVK